MKVFYKKVSVSEKVVTKMMEAACRKADELGIKINVAIADEGGNLKGFMRMDNAPLLSMEISQNKAYTAAAFGISTSEWYPMIKDEPELLYGIVHTNRLTIFGGGIPIEIDGQLAGGIGVSGGTAEQDALCAESALNVLKQNL